MKFWGWFLQRATGLALVLLVGVHVYLSYFAAPGSPITFELVQGRIHSTVMLVDLLLLYCALFHGLYGLNVVVTDYLPESKKVISALFCVLGIGLAFYGTSTLFTLL